MMSRLSLNSENKEDFDIKPSSYYWVLYNESYKIAKIKEIKTNNIYEYQLYELTYTNKLAQFIEISEKSFTTKDKTIFKYFDLTQINPENTDLATVYLISYPVLLYNFKFKANSNYNFSSAGKLFIGINITYNLLLNQNISNKVILSKVCDSIQSTYSQQNTDQTIIINGGSLTGKSILANYIWRTLLNNDFFRKQFKDEYISKEFEKTFTSLDKLVSLFGNAVIGDNNNSSRYLKVFKLYLLKFSNKNPYFTKIKSKYYLFEKNRIFNSLQFNNYYIFHIFHAVLEGLYWILTSDNDSIINSIFNDSVIDSVLVEIIKSNYLHLTDFIEMFRKKYNNLTEEYNNRFFKIYMDNFKTLISCVKSLNLSIDFLNSVFRIIISILLLLEIQFAVDVDGKVFFDRKSEDKDDLFYVSKILDCDIEILKKRLISREIKSPRGSFYIVK